MTKQHRSWQLMDDHGQPDNGLRPWVQHSGHMLDCCVYLLHVFIFALWESETDDCRVHWGLRTIWWPSRLKAALVVSFNVLLVSLSPLSKRPSFLNLSRPSSLWLHVRAKTLVVIFSWRRENLDVWLVSHISFWCCALFLFFQQPLNLMAAFQTQNRIDNCVYEI